MSLRIRFEGPSVISMILVSVLGSLALRSPADTDRVTLTNAQGDEVSLMFSNDGSLVMSSETWQGATLRFGPGPSGMHGISIRRADAEVDVGVLRDGDESSAGLVSRHGADAVARIGAGPSGAGVDALWKDVVASRVFASDGGGGLRLVRGVGDAASMLGSGWFPEHSAMGLFIKASTDGGQRLRGGVFCDESQGQGQVFLARSAAGEPSLSWGGIIRDRTAEQIARSGDAQVVVAAQETGQGMIVTSKGVDVCLLGANAAGRARLRLQGRSADRAAQVDVDADGGLAVDLGLIKRPDVRLLLDANGKLAIEQQEK